MINVSIIFVVVSSLFQYTMDSSNKDITIDDNPLSEFSSKSYTGDIVLLVSVIYNFYSFPKLHVCLIYFIPFSKDITIFLHNFFLY